MLPRIYAAARIPAVWVWVVGGALTGCGQEPSFVDDPSGRRVDGGGVDDQGMLAPDDVDSKGETAGDKEGSDIDPGKQGGQPASGAAGKPNSKPEPLPDIPAADKDDLDALHKCMTKWQQHPFKGSVQNYTKISAAVTVGGIGNAVNDSERTDEPHLILIDAGVNVLGSPVYNLLNPNGYYCIKVNVNVLTNLTVNLHCRARLADQKVNINVGSQQNDTTSSVGVHVLSSVKVQTVRPEGDTCIR